MGSNKQDKEFKKYKKNNARGIAVESIGRTAAVLAAPFIFTFILGQKIFSKLEDKKLNLSLQEFLDQNSAGIDEIILSTEKNEDMIFLAGRIILEAKKDNILIAFSQLYFKKQGEHFLKEIKLDPIDMEMMFNDEAIAEIQAEEQIEFEIEHPNCQFNSRSNSQYSQTS